jgi:PAS domain S-box-containing protein
VAILRTALDGYWMVDMQGRILDVNDAGCRMHGYTREEMLRMAIADFETDESPAGIVEQIQRIMRAGSSRSERTHRCKDGSHINLDISSNYRPTSGGRLIAFLRDITERKQKEAVLAQLNAQLQTKNRELEQVVHVISHDLRSPLVNIDGYGRELGGAVETLARALEAGATTIEALTEAVRPIVQGMSIDLQYIRSSAAHMDVLLTGLMKLSRYGRSGLTIAPLNMNELVAKVVATTTFQLDQNAVELEVAELPPCQGDAVQVVQVFTNLLGNALKYLDPGRRGVIRIRGGIESQHVVYCVEDNGVGIAPAHQEKIFEIFHRLDPFKSQGEGLGLTIVRQAVGRLAGDAWVESKPGEGSRFYVRLPAAQG